jgi:hypothetical protein
MSQLPFWLSKAAAGKPQELGFGLPAVISAGIAFLGKKKILMKLLVHSMAYTPPPWAFRDEP